MKYAIQILVHPIEEGQHATDGEVINHHKKHLSAMTQGDGFSKDDVIAFVFEFLQVFENDNVEFVNTGFLDNPIDHSK